DIVLAGDDIQKIQIVKALLNVKFKIKDLGQLKYFLGLKFARSEQGINLSQRKYAIELLEDVGLLGCEPVSTPIQLGIKFPRQKGIPIHMCMPIEDFLITMQQQYLRYIKNNPRQGLFFPSNPKHALKDFSDSDWAACLDTRRFVIGCNVFYGASLISWKSKKQGTISRSLTKA
ncbi:uncharacterized mitochondrial protein AtMg00810-like, partial [Vigna umbellata]|uniref:uncharacterized mitochondrial protein AtMg00810-like n=1 Tax=Vigna umbellata TaxID=87088 RepID=UPI001F5E7D9E